MNAMDDPRTAPTNPSAADDLDSRASAAATAARMYDYFLGGVHNFAADRKAAQKIVADQPDVPMIAAANRAFLRRSVRYLTANGVRQFLDIGSGIPTVGNVHEIAQAAAPGSRVVYVDIDPVAVDECREILADNPDATAIRGDLQRPRQILDHRDVRNLIDLSQPVGLLLIAVLHFVPDDDRAYRAVAHLVDALAPGSYVALSHGASETFQPTTDRNTAADVYREHTSTPGKARTRPEVEKFLTGLDLVEPGIVWVPRWRPDPHQPPQVLLADNPARSGVWAAVAKRAAQP